MKKKSNKYNGPISAQLGDAACILKIERYVLHPVWYIPLQSLITYK